MANQIMEQLSELFVMGEWEHKDSYFYGFKPEPLENRCKTSDMYPHFQKGRGVKLEANSPITSHFIADDSGVIPISAFEPKDSSELRFRPIGNIPFFDPNKYITARESVKALQFLFSPIPYKNHYALNIDLKRNPALIGMCSSVANILVHYMAQRPNVEVAAELRTRDDQQSTMLVKFKDSPLLIFDRCAGCYKDLPQELLLGWYAPLYTGPNKSQLPQFQKYRIIYEAYNPSTFILNRANLHIKNA